MRRWLRVLALYSPAIALTVAGVAVLLLTPLFSYSAPSGGCAAGLPPGTYNCPAAYPGTPTLNLAGPLLLLGAGFYAVAAFAFTLLSHRKSRPGMRAPQQA